MSAIVLRRAWIWKIMATLIFSGPHVCSAGVGKIDKVEFDQANLGDLVAFLREGASGKARNVVIDPRVNREITVSLRLFDVTKGVAFAYAAELGGFDYREEEYAIRIVPRSAHAGVKALLKRGRPVMARRVSRLIMPKIEFDETSLGEAIEGLVEASLALDPSKKRVNMLLGQGVDPSLPVTLRLQNIPLGQVLKYLAEFSNLEVRIDGNAVLLLNRKASGR